MSGKSCVICQGTGEVLVSADPINPSCPNYWERCDACDGEGVCEVEEDEFEEEQSDAA